MTEEETFDLPGLTRGAGGAFFPLFSVIAAEAAYYYFLCGLILFCVRVIQRVIFFLLCSGPLHEQQQLRRD